MTDRERFERIEGKRMRAHDLACDAERAGDHALALAWWLAAAHHADEAARAAHLQTLVAVHEGHARRARVNVKFWTEYLYKG